MVKIEDFESEIRNKLEQDEYMLKYLYEQNQEIRDKLIENSKDIEKIRAQLESFIKISKAAYFISCVSIIISILLLIL